MLLFAAGSEVLVRDSARVLFPRLAKNLRSLPFTCTCVTATELDVGEVCSCAVKNNAACKHWDVFLRPQISAAIQHVCRFWRCKKIAHLAFAFVR